MDTLPRTQAMVDTVTMVMSLVTMDTTNPDTVTKATVETVVDTLWKREYTTPMIATVIMTTDTIITIATVVMAVTKATTGTMITPETRHTSVLRSRK